MALPRVTPVLFAVFDSDDPANWKPWGTSPITHLQSKIKAIDSASLSQYRETFVPDLVAKPVADLLALESWRGIIGSVIDSGTLPRPEIRAAHRKLCDRIQADGEPLCWTTGYYLVFCVIGQNSQDQQDFMNDLRNDANLALKLTKSKKKTTAFRATSDEVFKAVVEFFVSQMEIVSAEG